MGNLCFLSKAINREKRTSVFSDKESTEVPDTQHSNDANHYYPSSLLIITLKDLLKKKKRHGKRKKNLTKKREQPEHENKMHTIHLPWRKPHCYSRGLVAGWQWGVWATSCPQSSIWAVPPFAPGISTFAILINNSKKQ